MPATGIAAGTAAALEGAGRGGGSVDRGAVSDACLGLKESVGDFYPEAKWQRCIVHFYRNVFSFVPKAKLKEVTIIDTLGFVAVKDSLFKNSDRYKQMMNVPYAPNNETFTMKADIVENSVYRAPIFEAKVSKSVILSDQPKDLLARENAQISVEEVNGTEIKVGSLKLARSTNFPWSRPTKSLKARPLGLLRLPDIRGRYKPVTSSPGSLKNPPTTATGKPPILTFA